jgi:hypothetical protein
MPKIAIKTPPCFHCNSVSEIEVDDQAYNNWKAGQLIQNAFPNFTLQERELLKTGIHPDCWDILFPDEDD